MEGNRLYRAIGIYSDELLDRANTYRDAVKSGLHPVENVLTPKPVKTPGAAKAAITQAMRAESRAKRVHPERYFGPVYKDYRIEVTEIKWEEWSP